MTNGTTKWRLCFVSPRYKIDHAGGAEILTENLAKRLSANGHSVEVFTTSAQDHYTWKNHYPAGVIKDGAVSVSRFNVSEDRDTIRFLQIQKKINTGINLSKGEELAWIDGSVHSKTLYKEIEKRQKDFDWFIFAPYLFGITYRGSLMFPEKSLVIPCLHDESFAYLSIFQDMFDRVRGILFNSYPERELAKRLYNLDEGKCAQVGMGFDEHPVSDTDIRRFKEKYGLSDKPYILYAGRREPGKNTPLLIEYVRSVNKNNDRKIRLVLIGTGEVKIPQDSQEYILDLGFLSPAEKYCAYAGAALFCQPSVNESLSIVIMESWLAGVPVIVNAKCAVTTHHCRKSNGGLYFKDIYEFGECVSTLFTNEQLRLQLAENGRKYVKEEYSWQKVIKSLEELLERLKTCR